MQRLKALSTKILIIALIATVGTKTVAQVDIVNDRSKAIRLVQMAKTAEKQNQQTTSLQNQQNWFAVAPVLEDRAINVFVKQQDKQAVALTLAAEDGTRIWKRTFKQALVEKSLMLNDLPDGHYRLSALNDMQFATYSFALQGSKVLIRPHQSTHTISPTVAVHGRSVIVDCAAVDSDKPVKMTITNNDGSVFFEQELKPGRERAIKYDLRDWHRGTYQLKFEVMNRIFERTIQLR